MPFEVRWNKTWLIERYLKSVSFDKEQGLIISAPFYLIHFVGYTWIYTKNMAEDI